MAIQDCFVFSVSCRLERRADGGWTAVDVQPQGESRPTWHATAATFVVTAPGIDVVREVSVLRRPRWWRGRSFDVHCDTLRLPLPSTSSPLESGESPLILRAARDPMGRVRFSLSKVIAHVETLVWTYENERNV